MITANDVLYVLSGGPYNSDPNASLGGEPSNRVVWGTTNNLFDDVTSTEAEDGHVDYRCIYVANQHASDPFYDTKLYIESQVFNGSNIEIGIIKQTDVQQVIVSGIAEGGSFQLTYEDTTVTVNWNIILSQ